MAKLQGSVGSNEMRKVARVFFYCFSMLVLILVFLEILVRVWGYSRMYFYDPIYMPYGKSPEIPYVMKPNLHHVRAHGNIWINTDALGLRSPVRARTYGNKQAGEYRIAFVGDSVTFGVGVPTADTYPEIVEKSLNHLQHQCQVNVFNFAVSSYSLKEMTATLQYRVAEVSPDLVVMGIIIDDFDTNRTPQVDKFGYNTHGSASQLVNKFHTLKLILRNIHLSYLIRDVLSRTIMHQEKNYESTNGNLPPILASSYKNIKEFKKLSEEHNYSYLVVTLPSAGSNGSQFTGIINNMKHDKINYYDTSFITPLFTVKQYRASTYDWHPSALVHQKIGKILSAYILNNFLVKACFKKLTQPYPDRPTGNSLAVP
jgi:GDSL-like Lipase/Acylhydrolase